MRFWRSYDPRPVLRAVTFVLVTVPLSGCIIDERTSGASGGTPGGGSASGDVPLGDFPTACPRAADFGATKPRPPKDAAELARAVEVCNLNIADAQARGLDIQYTVQMPSGDFYDWVTPVSLGIASGPDPVLSDQDLTLPPDFDFLASELTLNPTYGGPAGLVPIFRQHFSLYVSGNSGAGSLDEFLANSPSGSPTAPGRLYAGLLSALDSANSPIPTEGATAWVMPYYSNQPMDPGTMSLLEMAVACRNKAGEVQELIGVAASRDYANNIFPNSPDTVLRLQIEFQTQGDKKLGERLGGWAGGISQNDFRTYNNKSPLVPGMILFPSTVGGPQFASRFTIEHERIPNSDVGRWWIKFNDIKIGYYFDSLFVTLPTGACEALWYIEAYNPGRDPKNPGAPAPNWPPLGSGNWAMAGLGQASFFAGMAYLDSTKTLTSPVNGITLDKAKGTATNADCYTSYGPVSLLPPFDPILFLSGPGSAAPNNACPPPP